MTSENINLNFINKSSDSNNSSVVIFQQNVAEDFDELAVAWRVIKNVGYGGNHPFTYPIQFDVTAKDSWGNPTPELAAYEGQAFDMVRDNSGDVLIRSTTPATSSEQVEIRNGLDQGTIDALIYRGGKLLAQKTNLAPGQKAVFEFHPRIYIGAVSRIEEGQVMNSAILSQVNTELSLFGIASADIVMTGKGTDAKPYAFQLANVTAA